MASSYAANSRSRRESNSSSRKSSKNSIGKYSFSFCYADKKKDMKTGSDQILHYTKTIIKKAVAWII